MEVDQAQQSDQKHLVLAYFPKDFDSRSKKRNSYVAIFTNPPVKNMMKDS